MLENSGAAELPGVVVEEERRVIDGGTVLEQQQRHESSGGGAGGSGGGGGNRWPHEETMALLKIRLEMDAVFRDTGFKGPLWDEVSRKLAELGYHRSAKKCREKFENMCKYHKRTKHQGSRLNGKAYRFYDILEAFDHSDYSTLSPFPEQMDPGMAVTPVSYMMPHSVPTLPSSIPDFNSNLRFSESSSDEESEGDQNMKNKWEARFSRVVKTILEKQEDHLNKCLEVMDRSDRDRMARFEAWQHQEMARMKREREVWEKQMSIVAARDAALIEFLQKISERGGKSSPEQGRSSPEQAKIPPEQANIPPEQGNIPPEQANIPPKQANIPPEQAKIPPEQAKIPPEQANIPPEQGNIPPEQVKHPLEQVKIPLELGKSPLEQGNNSLEQAKSPLEQVKSFQAPEYPSTIEKVFENEDNGSSADRSMHSGSGGSSRWPKEEVDALIKVRTDMEHDHQGNGSKGPLWEEISVAMRKLGYDRNAKRCKEKWENINKYYRRAKDSNKKRSAESKACAYFPQLDALYSSKFRKSDDNLVTNPGFNLRPEELLMHMVNQNPGDNEEEPPSKKHHTASHGEGVPMTNEGMNGGAHQNGEEDGDGEDDEESGGGEFQIVANGNSSKQIME